MNKLNSLGFNPQQNKAKKRVMSNCSHHNSILHSSYKTQMEIRRIQQIFQIFQKYIQLGPDSNASYIYADLIINLRVINGNMLFRVEQEIFKLEETVKKQAETIEQLEKKLSKDKSLVRFHNLVSQPFINFHHSELEIFFLQLLGVRILDCGLACCSSHVIKYNTKKVELGPRFSHLWFNPDIISSLLSSKSFQLLFYLLSKKRKIWNDILINKFKSPSNLGN